MTDTDPLELLLKTVDNLGRLVEVVETEHENLAATIARTEELAGDVAELGVKLERFHLIVGAVLNMKAARLTSTCLRCGATLCTEPGPQLCGPCWTELGRPERYLAAFVLVTTAKETDTP